MAATNGKKTEETTLAVVVPSKTELVPAPDYLKEVDRRGLEDMSSADMLIPRLALAQALSPQVTEGDPRRIADLKPGDLFNSVTGQRYGREAFVQILRRMPLRAMEFNDMNDGGGVKDPNVPLNDERLKWIGDSKPVATLFMDYIALLLPDNEIIALSFKSSGIKVAKTLNGLMGFRNRAIFAGRYRFTTDMMLVPKPHYIYKVENAGWVTEEQAAYGEQMYEAAAGLKAEHIQRQVENDEPWTDEAGNDRVSAEM